MRQPKLDCSLFSRQWYHFKWYHSHTCFHTHVDLKYWFSCDLICLGTHPVSQLDHVWSNSTYDNCELQDQWVWHYRFHHGCQTLWKGRRFKLHPSTSHSQLVYSPAAHVHYREVFGWHCALYLTQRVTDKQYERRKFPKTPPTQKVTNHMTKSY